MQHPIVVLYYEIIIPYYYYIIIIFHCASVLCKSLFLLRYVSFVCSYSLFFLPNIRNLGISIIKFENKGYVSLPFFFFLTWISSKICFDSNLESLLSS